MSVSTSFFFIYGATLGWSVCLSCLRVVCNYFRSASVVSSLLPVSVCSGAVSYGAHYQLKLMYEHNMQRTSFNFCFGPFGGVKGQLSRGVMRKSPVRTSSPIRGDTMNFHKAGDFVCCPCLGREHIKMHTYNLSDEPSCFVVSCVFV